MNFQEIIVGILFLAALLYVGRILYRTVRPKNKKCGANCKCGVDFSEIEKK
ncbi:FeoB-associated Cys-rich membrane protein [Solitalea koreensis]|uniref:Virus attachment protein p12 family protein n=1 Tax=Solitalea koreensis TaxID=543615 RepID=A0A521CMI5_9SPHI|nr:FeoB-associated Cys-rich membrane protein [Solitalea koreensis]SMO60585.1 Virus attachment protein p12 family protein [Solitalea koreensis]